MKVMSMSHPQYVKTGICEKYQTLLEECERALAIWNEHRAEIAKAPVIAKEAGDELLRYRRSMHELIRCCRTTRASAPFASW
jgi:hypothetical protein